AGRCRALQALLRTLANGHAGTTHQGPRPPVRRRLRGQKCRHREPSRPLPTIRAVSGTFALYGFSPGLFLDRLHLRRLRRKRVWWRRPWWVAAAGGKFMAGEVPEWPIGPVSKGVNPLYFRPPRTRKTPSFLGVFCVFR